MPHQLGYACFLHGGTHSPHTHGPGVGLPLPDPTFPAYSWARQAYLCPSGLQAALAPRTMSSVNAIGPFVGLAPLSTLLGNLAPSSNDLHPLRCGASVTLFSQFLTTECVQTEEYTQCAR